MNLSRRVSISALLWALAAIASHADVKDLPVRKVNGKLYHYYEVPAKETVYSLCYKLGITKDQLVKDNPAVADGLKSGMTLFFPHESENSESTTNLANPGRIINHKVEKGETIYGIARKYGTSTDRILNDNPILQSGLKAGQTITIKTDASATAPASVRESEVENNKQSTDSQNSGTMNAYIVKKKETFYSIAHAHGITVAQLEAANPGVISLKAGQVLNIPGNIGQTAASNDMIAEEKQQPTSDFNTTTSKEQDKQSTISDNTLVETPDSVTAQKSDKHISIAVMLPFMLKEENPSKVALRCTEFYKGLLIAADSLRNTSASIHIKAFDTKGSTLTVRETLSSPDFGEFDYIIAPDNSEQLSVLGEWSRKHNTKVLNGFIVRNDSYVTNPGMMQGNLPSPMMIEKAVEGMSERLRYSTPVFLSINNSPSDKADFVALLKKSLDAKGISYMDVAVDGKLMPANLKALPVDGSYTFIPLSGKQADLNKLMPGIIEWRDEAVKPTVKMFGYPEWITYRGETLENMHKLNTTVYSRFYADEDGARARDIDAKFHRWYGKGMDPAVPRQGLLGFDTGMYLIRHIANNEEKYDGVQNGYRFVTTPNGGSYNDVLYFINFRPGGITEKYNL